MARPWSNCCSPVCVLRILITDPLFQNSSDSERCLLLAATHTSTNACGQRRVHGVPNCGQGAQLVSSSKTASDHPSGAHHSQLLQGCKLSGLLCLYRLTMCCSCSGGREKPWDRVETSSWHSSCTEPLLCAHHSKKKKKELYMANNYVCS